jgi:hypothetical protein
VVRLSFIAKDFTESRHQHESVPFDIPFFDERIVDRRLATQSKDHMQRRCISLPVALLLAQQASYWVVAMKLHCRH